MAVHLFPVLGSSYEPGSCDAVVSAFGDDRTRALAVAELAGLRGEAGESLSSVRPLLHDKDVLVRIMAASAAAHAHILQGDFRRSKEAYAPIGRLFSCRGPLRPDAPVDEVDVCLNFVQDMIQVTLHFDFTPAGRMPAFDYARHLSKGPRLYAGYISAYRAHLARRHEFSLGIARTCLAAAERPFPVAESNLHLVAAMDLIGLKRVDEAVEEFDAALGLALPDRMLTTIAMHAKLLGGLLEVRMRDRHPQEYRRVIEIAETLDRGRVGLLGATGDKGLSFGLTAMEYSVASLASRGWTNAEIAAYIGISFHTVKHHLGVAYSKLGVSGRGELGRFLMV